ncbi:twin-arginine translocase subunit TatC [Desulforudis sp. 1088]|uniref:twin-arginine translocase subunit TatC n=1 Tax=unclassified Candidatus Desulforudis TaxID=2635950 RepID=UPI00346A1D88
MARNPEKELSIYDHLGELRRVIIVSLLATVAMAGVCYTFSDRIMAILLEPVTEQGYKIVFVGVTEALFTKIKLSLFLGFIAAMPVTLQQVWSFIAPALRKEEKKFAALFVFVSFILFVGGVLFAFFVVYKMGVKFLLQFAGPELVPMLTIGNYISFTISFLVPFGLVFELPLASFFLSKMGILTHALLAKNRKYAFLGILVIAAAITPTPDLLTMSFMAGPMYLMYELSVWITRMVERGKARKAREEALAEEQEMGVYQGS